MQYLYLLHNEPDEKSVKEAVEKAQKEIDKNLEKEYDDHRQSRKRVRE